MIARPVIAMWFASICAGADGGQVRADSRGARTEQHDRVERFYNDASRANVLARRRVAVHRGESALKEIAFSEGLPQRRSTF
jgi:hypothetical protein